MVNEQYEMFQRCICCCTEVDILSLARGPAFDRPDHAYDPWPHRCKDCSSRGVQRPIRFEEWGFPLS